MNGRIKELLGQAYDEAVPETWTTLSSEQLGRIYEKFAELIVQECLDTIQRGIDNGGGANEDIVMAGKLALFYSYRNIQYRFGMGDYKDKEHLGVRE